MREPVAILPPPVVVVLTIGGRDGFQGLVEIPQRAVLVLDGGHRCRRSRHEDIEQAIAGANLDKPIGDVGAQIDDVAEASGVHRELAMIGPHVRQYTAGANGRFHPWRSRRGTRRFEHGIRPPPILSSRRVRARIGLVRVGVRALATSVSGVLLPALCVACEGVLTGDDRGLCAHCRSRLLPLSGPCCPRCGVPADSDADGPCLTCVADPPPQGGTVVWGVYDGVLRRTVLALKHHGHDELARGLGWRLAARIVLAPWSGEIDAVVAVPSHGLRQFRRGWSAAGLLAREVAAALGQPLIPALLRHGLRRQTGRTRAQRRRLPRGSFSARRLARHRTLLLVDDVCTTGTTLRRAAETLIGAGADAVYCATLAHAPDPRSI